MIRFDSIIFDDDTINDGICASNISDNGKTAWAFRPILHIILMDFYENV